MNHFFAFINRTKYINRWGLMRNTETENLQEHSFSTAVVAHALAVIEREKFGSAVNPERVAILALYHDVSEIITGDMPTPVKYYNDEIKRAYKHIEKETNDMLIEKLPDFMRPEYSAILSDTDSVEHKIVKAADTLSAYIKCIEEKKAGNRDFDGARAATEEKLKKIELKSLEYFISEFLQSYELTIDEMR